MPTFSALQLWRYLLLPYMSIENKISFLVNACVVATLFRAELILAVYVYVFRIESTFVGLWKPTYLKKVKECGNYIHKQDVATPLKADLVFDIYSHIFQSVLHIQSIFLCKHNAMLKIHE